MGRGPDRGTCLHGVVDVMAVGIHPIHRRLAELQVTAKRRGGWHMLSTMEQQEMYFCLQQNAALILKLDGLKELTFHAHIMGDMDWQQELCSQIEDLESAFQI